MKSRLPFTTFEFPIPEFRRGYYSAVYFWREKRILELEGIRSKGLMQIFNKVDNAVVCGVDEALAVLRLCTGTWSDYYRMHELFDRYQLLRKQRRSAFARRDYSLLDESNRSITQVLRGLDELWVDEHQKLEIKALMDGDQSPACHAVMTIKGEASVFAHLESVYLGILARGTKVATNTRRVVDAAKGKPVLFFADRFDRWSNQASDGYASSVGGSKAVATDAMGGWWGNGGSGTMPHALIAMYEGDTPAATLAFAKRYPDVKTISLVDFHNDCVQTSVEVARAFRAAGLQLGAVRLDTSGTLVDKSIQGEMGLFRPTGVCALLVEKVRRALDLDGFNSVEIVVSGGFNPERIAAFEKAGVPVDAYGVGSSLLEGNFDHTADIVMVDGRPMAKVGRYYRPGSGLRSFSWNEIEPQ